MSRGDKAYAFFNDGYNCSQAVALAFADLYPDKADDMVKIMSSFGGGFGRMREVCGAFSGICAVLGLLCGFDGKNGVSKAEHYAIVRELGEKFKKDNGSLVCRELLGATAKLSSEDPSVRSAEYKAKRPCAELCRYCADILEQKLIEKGVI